MARAAILFAAFITLRVESVERELAREYDFYVRDREPIAVRYQQETDVQS